MPDRSIHSASPGRAATSSPAYDGSAFQATSRSGTIFIPCGYQRWYIAAGYGTAVIIVSALLMHVLGDFTQSQHHAPPAFSISRSKAPLTVGTPAHGG